MLQAKHFMVLLVAIAIFPPTFPAMAADTFPVHIMGQTIELGIDTDRKTVASELEEILPQDTQSVFNEDRIQYDYIAVAGQAPACIAVDFDAKGKFVGGSVDAFEKKQNPVAQELVQWLKDNVGPGEKTGNGLTWNYAGLTFEFIDISGAGEDSSYGVFIKKIAE